MREVEADLRAASLASLVATLEAGERSTRAIREGAIEALDAWLERGYEPPRSLREEARLIVASRWILDERPDHPVIQVWIARAPQILRDLDADPLAALLASFVFEHSIRNGNFGAAGRLVAEMRDRTASSASARLAWLPSAALYLWLSGQAQAALAAVQPALDDPLLAASVRYALLEQAATAALASADPALAVEYLGRADELLEGLSPRDRAQAWLLRAGAAALSGDVEGAGEAMRRCEAHGREVDARFFRALWRLGAEVVRVEAGQARRADRELGELLGDVVLMRARYLEWSVRMARAAARLALGRMPAAEADLGAALRIAAEHGYVTCDPWGVTPQLRTMLELALRRGIEPTTARALLAQCPL